jgi:hypothetical protein
MTDPRGREALPPGVEGWSTEVAFPRKPYGGRHRHLLERDG